jgi:RNA polymerase subunit RPABC4/transcription elongation factor Spt4
MFSAMTHSDSAQVLLRAALDQWQSTYRKVRSPSWIVRASTPLLVLGVLAFFLCVALLMAGRDWAIWPGIAVFIAMGFLIGVFCPAGVRHEADFLRAHSFLLCTRCGYSLNGLPHQGVCPECGAPYTAEEAESFWSGYLTCRENIHRYANQSARD